MLKRYLHTHVHCMNMECMNIVNNSQKVETTQIILWWDNWINKRWYAHAMKYFCCCLVTKSCLTLCDSMGCSLPGSSVHGISQAKILEWVAVSFSRYLPNSGTESMSPAWQANSLPLSHLEKSMKYYSPLKGKKKDTLVSHATILMNLEDIMLSEIKRHILYDSTYMRYLEYLQSWKLIF